MTHKSQIRGIAVGALALVAVAGWPSRARADTIALSVSSGPTIQQTSNSPCIIGDPSCQNSAGFSYTLIEPRFDSGWLVSPTYTVEQIRNLVGNTFSVGVDLNQAVGQDGGAYVLQSFMMTVNGSLVWNTTAPSTLFPLNPGNGYSDATIRSFDLSGLDGNATLLFSALVSGATAGREQFFLVSNSLGSGGGGGGGGGTNPLPEPTTLLLIGSGLAGLAAGKRRLQSTRP